MVHNKKNVEEVYQRVSDIDHVIKRPDMYIGSIKQDEINKILIEKAMAGHEVVRLKGGDPFIFARGSEEAIALKNAGITCSKNISPKPSLAFFGNSQGKLSTAITVIASFAL